MGTPTKVIRKARKATEQRLPDFDVLVDRAEEVSGAARDAARDRADEVSAVVRNRAKDAQPLLRSVAVGLLEAFQMAIQGLLTIPRVLLKILELLQRALASADVAKDRGAVYAERALQATRYGSGRSRRQQRLRQFGLFSVAFSAGAVIGWLLTARRPVEVVTDGPVVLQPVGDEVADSEASDTDPSGDPANGSEASTGT